MKALPLHAEVSLSASYHCCWARTGWKLWAKEPQEQRCLPRQISSIKHGTIVRAETTSVAMGSDKPSMLLSLANG
jgi:hypothetical protein